MEIAPAVSCAPESPESLLQERTRSHELAKYFTASSIVPLAPQPDLEHPAPFPDTTLTALAQLGVYKLDCERSFISLIDSSHQYIIGEATRSGTSSSHALKAHSNGLYLGFRALELSWGVCPQTIKVFTSDNMIIDTKNIYADRSRYIIHDFGADDHFSTRPYVTGFPYMRSYAEVPLTSPSGFVIGSYCVVDDKPRDYNDAEIATLADVADNIMSHLELMKTRLEFLRVEGLVRGIGSYVAGFSSLREQQTLPESANLVRPPAVRQMSSGRVDTLTSSSSPSRSTDNVASADHSQAHRSPSTTTESADKLAINAPILSLDSSKTASEPEEGTILSPEVSKAFFRAGNIIHQSMEMQGVAFMDALEATSNTSRRQSTNSGMRATSDKQSFRDDAQDSRLFSYSVQAGDRHEMKPDGSSLRVPETLLRRMLARYPFGHILSSDAQGAIVRSHTDPNQQHRKHPSRQTFGSPPFDDEDQENRDAADMFEACPGARSIVFLPLWDFQKDRWFAACLGWTSNPTRILSVADLNYFSAFGNSIMSEISRLEAAALSDAKSSFISSVSHELRSPLHGILAGTELLRESIKSSEEASMLDTITSCGTTLLDTVDHLLDFAKINSLITRPADLLHSADIAPDDNAKASPIVDLSTLLQDMVEVVHLGFVAKQPTQDVVNDVAGHGSTVLEPGPHAHNQTVTVILVNIRPDIDWSFETDPGAWKRIIMNLLGNALKYTSRGHVSVNLTLIDHHTGEGDLDEKAVRLDIIDTGRGISKEYLQHRLFQPFAQEDNLSVGTGLGLSIVYRLVEGLQGTIDVRSIVGTGTSVNVVVPIGDTLRAASEGSKVEPTTINQRLDPAGRLRGRRLFLTTSETSIQSTENGDVEIPAMESLFGSIASASLGMQVIVGQPPSAEAHSDEYYFILHPNDHGMMSSNWALRGVRRVAQHLTENDSGTIGMSLSHPFGPRKMASALLDIIDRLDSKSSIALDLKVPGNVDHTIDLEQLMRNVKITPEDISAPTSTQGLTAPTPSSSGLARVSSRTSNSSTRPIHVLIVDDNPTNLKVLSMCATKSGCKVTQAEDGQQAIDAFIENTTGFDIIFMDLSMPVKDGYQATQEIRAYETTSGVSRTPIYALTALVTDQAKQDALVSGVDRFISKPIQMKAVRELLREIGERSKGESEPQIE